MTSKNEYVNLYLEHVISDPDVLGEGAARVPLLE